MSKNVEIFFSHRELKNSFSSLCFSIPKAKSVSISVKIRQPFLWTDPYLPGLLNKHLVLVS